MRVRPPTPSTNGKARKQVLLPLLEQVAATAAQLSVEPEEVIALLKPLLKETHHE
jgi:hypothetical protein